MAWTRGVTFGGGKGRFYCPACWGEQPYHKRRVVQFIAIAGVPILPFDIMGHYIECQTCETTYDDRVLSFEPVEGKDRFEYQYELAVKRVLVLIMLADGVIDPTEVNTICDIYERVIGRPLTPAEVQAEVDDANAQGYTVEAYVRGLLGQLNERGKDTVIRAAFMVAAADGVFQDAERALLARLGKALQMAPKYLEQVMAAGPMKLDP